MNRFGLIVALLGAAGAAYAGPIAINLGSGGANVLNNNIAVKGFVPCNTGASPCPSGNAIANPGTNPVPSGNPTSFTNVLFNSVQVPFDVAPTTPTTSDDIWSPGNSAGTKSSTIDLGGYTGTTGTQDLGIADADEIWTMINDVYGTPGYQGVTLTLNGVTDGGTGITETIDLIAGVDYRSIGSLGIPNDNTPCDIANIGTATLGQNCDGDSSETAMSKATDSNSVRTSDGLGALSTTAGVTVTVHNSVYTTADTQGNNYWLDVQAIDLGGAFAGGYLDDVVISSNDGSSGMSDKVILSALTVDSPVPEPGTLVLFAAGLGGVALIRRRRAKKA